MHVVAACSQTSNNSSRGNGAPMSSSKEQLGHFQAVGPQATCISSQHLHVFISEMGEKLTLTSPQSLMVGIK